MKTVTKNSIMKLVDNPLLNERDLHQAWMDEMSEMGWSYGDQKDEFRKKHPLLVSYENLPVRERQKDALVKSIFEAITKDI